MARVAINGMGRIGRAALRILVDTPELDPVAINDLTPIEGIAYLLKYDTVYGKYANEVRTAGESLLVDGWEIRYYSEKDPSKLPWKDMEVDIAFECTGIFSKGEDLQKHLDAGAKRVILSAPAKSEDVPTIVHGVNRPEKGNRMISTASCTTNCITPVVEVIGRRIGIKKSMMTTIHAYTSSQAIVDKYNKKVRRGRAGAANLVPTSTGAALATTKALPQYEGKFDGVAVRAPVTVGSIADMVFLVERETSSQEVNDIFREEAGSDRYKGILGTSEDEIVSSDIIGDSRASIVDLSMTQVVDGDMVKIMSWYDNEWGYTNQMIREAMRISAEEL
jgi:glyceraldehyde 3-phosphate dehydrogenase